MDEDEELELPAGSSSVTLEEMEEASRNSETESKATKPGEVKLEGDSVPEKYRGKTLDDILRENADLERNARLAAAEREAFRAAAESGRQAPPPPPREEEPKELTREELAQMYQEDPLAAIEAMQNQAFRKAEKHLNVRLGQLESGTISAAESWARDTYKEEFELFGNQIKQFVDNLPNKSVFTSKQGWKDAIAYIRGQDDNMAKLIDHKSSGGRTSKTAREEQDQESGFSGGSSARSKGGRRTVRLNEDQKEAAKIMGVSDAEYIKWANLG